VRATVKEHCSGKRHTARLEALKSGDASAVVDRTRDPIQQPPLEGTAAMRKVCVGMVSWYISLAGINPEAFARYMEVPRARRYLAALLDEPLSANRIRAAIRESVQSTSVAVRRLFGLSTVVHLAADESPLRIGSRRAWAVVAMTDLLPGLPLLVDFYVEGRYEAFGSDKVQELVENMMDDYGISREQLCLFASDNASYMNCAVSALGCPRIADIAHVINLIMKELLPDESKPMQLASRLGRFASRAGRERLENVRSQRLDLGRLKSCGTRWGTRWNVLVYVLDLDIRRRLMAVLVADRGSALVDEIIALLCDKQTWAEAVCILDL